MKTFLFAAFMIASFTMNATITDPVSGADTKIIKTEESSIAWTGKKITGQHTGTINFESGSLDFDNGVLVGGTFSIDMNSIKCTDLAEKGAQKLEGHLKSDDFFGVPNHPTADLTITKVIPSTTTKGAYDVMADIQIKGITKPISFSAMVGDNEASANVVINRTDFDIRYGSGSFFDDLGDKTIYDDFELTLQLKY